MLQIYFIWSNVHFSFLLRLGNGQDYQDKLFSRQGNVKFHSSRKEDAFPSHMFLKRTKKFQPTDFFFNSNRKQINLFSNEISNVGQTTLALFFALSLISIAVLGLNNWTDIPSTNHPDAGDFINTRIESVLNFLNSSYETVLKPFDGKQHLFIENQDSFVCPVGRNGLQTIGSCFFFYADFVIHDLLVAIPSFGKYVFDAATVIIGKFAPQHFVFQDGLNEVFTTIQRFLHLPKDKTTKPQTTGTSPGKSNSTDSSEDLSRASFSFEPFSEDVIQIKAECESQCKSQTSAAASFLFDDLTDISTVTNPISRRDYIFNELNEPSFFICQHTRNDNFGGM